MGGKKSSGAAKRKKKKEKEEAIERAREEVERLKLGPSKLWTGLVLHHRDIFVSHVLPKLNKTDRWFFSKANIKHFDLLKYAGMDELKKGWSIYECTSISTLEWAWNNFEWGGQFRDGKVLDQAYFCQHVAKTNKLELLKWIREEKKCEWDEDTINQSAFVGNLEMLRYCFANGCPCEEETACRQAAGAGHLDCLRFLFEKVKPSRETEKSAAEIAAEYGQLDVLKYLYEERTMAIEVKHFCMAMSASGGHLDCLKYIVEEAKIPLSIWLPFAYARYYEQSECLHNFREKGSPEPTDAQYATFAAIEKHRLRVREE
jgi:hypothetical protein